MRIHLKIYVIIIDSFYVFLMEAFHVFFNILTAAGNF